MEPFVICSSCHSVVKVAQPLPFDFAEPFSRRNTQTAAYRDSSS